MSTVCVIGAGVSGLTSAIELQRRRHSVTVLTAAEGVQTTSSAAAAFWYPFWTGKDPDHSWYRSNWAWETYLALETFLEVTEAGVTSIELFEYFDEQMSDTEIENVLKSMWWQVFRRLRFQRLSPDEVRNVFYEGRERLGFRAGVRFRTLVINMAHYLPYLKSLFVVEGGKILRKHIESSELAPLCRDFDYVVNCTGLGAQELVTDSRMKSKEGVVVKVAPLPEVSEITLLHTGAVFSEFPVYIVPRGGPTPDIILGGTIKDWAAAPRHFDWSSVPPNEILVRNVAEAIIERCASIRPAILGATKLEIGVGYRPVRLPGIRLEPGTEVPGRLIHNYGHGGGGVTLSWGCAREVGAWLDRMCEG